MDLKIQFLGHYWVIIIYGAFYKVSLSKVRILKFFERSKTFRKLLWPLSEVVTVQELFTYPLFPKEAFRETAPSLWWQTYTDKASVPWNGTLVSIIWYKHQIKVLLLFTVDTTNYNKSNFERYIQNYGNNIDHLECIGTLYHHPWLVRLSGLSASLWMEMSLVHFPSGHMPGLQARSPVGGV